MVAEFAPSSRQIVEVGARIIGVSSLQEWDRSDHKVGELLDLGVKAGVVEKSGAWFSYDSQRIGQGRENAKQFLRDNPPMADGIDQKVRDQSGVVTNSMMSSPDEAEEAEAAE